MVFIEDLYQKYLHAGMVSIDTRQMVPGTLFFALRGPKFNANAFAEEALERGAAYVIIDDPEYAFLSDALLLVEDSKAALMALAAHHRLQLKNSSRLSVIAVTGSYGKTTTKELIYRVLSTTYKTVATKGNLNTLLGVALTLLSLSEDTEMAVVEMGATQLNDIALCCKMAQPTHGLITAIGEAHLDGFGDLAGVLKGKSELYDYLYETKGSVFLNTLDPFLVPLVQRFYQPITYPQMHDYAPLELVEAAPYLYCRTPLGGLLPTHLLGKPHMYNIAAALCIGQYFGIPTSASHQAIATYIPVNRRMELIQKGSNQLLIDSYNASPASVQAALDTLLQLEASYRVVVLGDMTELGCQSADWHYKITEQLCNPGYDLVLLCGPLFLAALEQKRDEKFHCFLDKETLADYLRGHSFQDSAILFKGANSLAIHTVAATIQ